LPEAHKKEEERKANAFVRRTNTVKKANGLAPVEMTESIAGGAEKKMENWGKWGGEVKPPLFLFPKTFYTA
jgi:uncharacterized protein YkwD